MAWYKMKAALDVGSVQITLEEKWDNERKKMAYRILVTGHKIDADYMHGTVIDIEAQILRKTAEKKKTHTFHPGSNKELSSHWPYKQPR